MKKETPPSIFVEGNPPLFIILTLLYDDVENISRFYEFILIFGNIRVQWERLKLQRSRNRCVARGGEGKRLYRLSAVPNRRRAGARVIFLTAVARNGRRSRLLSLMDKPCSWRSPPIPVALWVNYVRFFPRTTILWKTDFRFANTRLGYLTRLYLTDISASLPSSIFQDVIPVFELPLFLQAT